ncbi:MAG: RNA-binding S4 domain-containing protein [Bacteroidales bacterium]
MTLIQLLKFVGIAQSGAMAQELVEDGLVKVNHQVDYRKRAKIRRGDIVEIDDEVIEVN